MALYFRGAKLGFPDALAAIVGVLAFILVFFALPPDYRVNPANAASIAGGWAFGSAACAWLVGLALSELYDEWKKRRRPR